MADITKKFNDFIGGRSKEFDKIGEFKPLADDITVLKKLDTGGYEKIDGDVKILQVTGVITDPDEIKKLNEISGGPVINTDINLKQVKRGNIIFLTVLLQRPSNTSTYNTQSYGVLKCRIQDIFYGLNVLNTIKPEQGKIL